MERLPIWQRTDIKNQMTGAVVSSDLIFHDPQHHSAYFNSTQVLPQSQWIPTWAGPTEEERLAAKAILRTHPDESMDKAVLLLRQPASAVAVTRTRRPSSALYAMLLTATSAGTTVILTKITMEKSRIVMIILCSVNVPDVLLRLKSRRCERQNIPSLRKIIVS